MSAGPFTEAVEALDKLLALDEEAVPTGTSPFDFDDVAALQRARAVIERARDRSRTRRGGDPL